MLTQDSISKPSKPLVNFGLRDVCFSPDGKTLVTKGPTRLDLWDVSTGQHLKTIIELDKSDPDNRIKGVRFFTGRQDTCHTE